MVVLSICSRDKCTLFNDDEQDRHSHSHRYPSISMLILLILKFGKKRIFIFSQHTKSQKKLISEMRNQYTYQICTRLQRFGSFRSQLNEPDSCHSILCCKNMLFLVALTTKESINGPKKMVKKKCESSWQQVFNTHIELQRYRIAHRKFPALLNGFFSSPLHVFIQLNPFQIMCHQSVFSHFSSIVWVAQVLNYKILKFISQEWNHAWRVLFGALKTHKCIWLWHFSHSSTNFAHQTEFAWQHGFFLEQKPEWRIAKAIVFQHWMNDNNKLPLDINVEMA